ncbi:NRAMP family divalent metal transporter [Sulfoacidibacillus thermotolerans]|uniref:NRAMP family metal ion transporter n=1 Tax=Sulfoacidibacillus thermotolerans TaxID=1765684 RepID=A0A2U3DC86_SULT2|nr:divalent metal cation transporter [Sulfoacidibacillus thermotolerans]PWI58888.1 NRAMP family metal ion transporter [Sulfoacidibacillus thermotolerans]
MSNYENSFPETKRRLHALRQWLLWVGALGPGIMVMLADTDAGSVITAAQSGAQWGFRMILPQIILIPMLYVIQEITVRLGILTKKGHGELIREHFGMKWALLSVSTLFISSVGALITEFSGIAGVGQLFGVPPFASVGLVTVLLIVLGLSGSYRRIERIGIAVGLFELFFIVAAFLAHPNPHQIFTGLASLPLQNHNYLYLLAANVGAVIMPWMIFYQQGAVIDKKIQDHQLKLARWDTFGGSVLTQFLMIAVVITTAATIGQNHPNQPLNDVPQIAQALTPALGAQAAKIVFGLGMVGASFIAALVVSIAGAWGIGEAFRLNHSLNHKASEAKGFYLIFSLAHILGAIFVLFSSNLVVLAVDVEIMNAMLLPIVLGFLLVLEAKTLPKEWRMRGPYKWTVWGVSSLVILFGLYMTFISL